MTAHPAIAHAESIRRNSVRLLADGSIDRPTFAAWQAAAASLQWLGTNADTLRAIGRQIAAAKRAGRDLTPDEISALATRPDVAAVLQAFPDATLHDGGPIRRVFDGTPSDQTPSAEDAA